MTKLYAQAIKSLPSITDIRQLKSESFNFLSYKVKILPSKLVKTDNRYKKQPPAT